MPTYEYKCEECGVVFERFQHFSEEPLKTCPECEGTVHRIIHPVGIIFKGKGFYVTDHRGGQSGVAPASSSKDNEHKSASEDASGSSGGSFTSTDSYKGKKEE